MSKKVIDKTKTIKYTQIKRGDVRMKKEYVLAIDEDIVNKFSMALELTGDSKDLLVEDFMKNYIAQSFSKIAASLRGTSSMEEISVNSDEQNYGKALRKISKWAKKPSQINHKIVRAYLQLREELGTVNYETLQKRCDNKEEHPDVYISTFATNFAQMKFDGDKSHGKVFEVDEDGVVTLWAYIETEIMKYKKNFLVHTTDYGYENDNRQRNIGKTGLKGTDHMQVLYKMQCQKCGYEYNANGSDIFQKKCPKCQGGTDTGK